MATGTLAHVLASSHLLRRFRKAYAEHRRREGHHEISPRDLPYVRTGPLRKAWSVRARSFDTAIRKVIHPLEQSGRTEMRVADLGAGNGWLSYRLCQRGHRAIAVDIRADDVDGLGAAYPTAAPATSPSRLVADFAELPLRAGTVDLCVFNASFHYATSVESVLRESVRITRSGGRILIIDTPFYANAADGAQMVAEKTNNAAGLFGDLAADLTAIPFIEFLTPHQLTLASKSLGITWIHHRTRYPFWYEVRPWIARVRRRRPPSRFDVWEGIVAK